MASLSPLNFLCVPPFKPFYFHITNVSPREESKNPGCPLTAHHRSEFPTGWTERTRGRPWTQEQALRRLPVPALLITHTVSKLTEMFYCCYVLTKIPRYHFKTAIYFNCTHPCRTVILMAQQSKVAQETEVGAVQTQVWADYGSLAPWATY